MLIYSVLKITPCLRGRQSAPTSKPHQSPFSSAWGYCYEWFVSRIPAGSRRHIHIRIIQRELSKKNYLRRGTESGGEQKGIGQYPV